MKIAQILATALLAAGLAGPAAVQAQSEETPVQLAGTLAKVRAAGSVVVGYRESSVPFSYLSPRGEPIGYSIDLCKLLVDSMSEAVGRPLSIRWRAVTPDN